MTAILSVVGVAVTIMAAALYAFGRSYLIAWHTAAGVPMLTFSFPTTDVILIGFIRLTWLLWLGYFIINVIGVAYLAGWISTKSLSLLIPERLSDWFESKGHLMTQAILSWKKTRIAHGWVPVSLDRIKGVSDLANRFFHGVGQISVVVFFVGGLFFAIEVATEQGARDFQTQFEAATGRSDIQSQKPNSGKEFQSLPFAYVRVKSKLLKEGNGGDETIECGWLVQATDKQVLLLTIEGVKLFAFGDQPFWWERIPTSQMLRREELSSECRPTAKLTDFFI